MKKFWLEGFCGREALRAKSALGATSVLWRVPHPDRFEEGVLTPFCFSKAEVESQVIPILLVRDELDVAHPVGSRIKSELITVLRQYIARSVTNVRAILLRVARMIEREPNFLQDVSGDLRSRIQLCESLMNHLRQPELKDELDAVADAGENPNRQP